MARERTWRRIEEKYNEKLSAGSRSKRKYRRSTIVVVVSVVLDNVRKTLRVFAYGRCINLKILLFYCYKLSVTAEGKKIVM